MQPWTLRFRACDRRASACKSSTKLDEAAKSLDESIAALRPLTGRAGGDASVALTLAEAMHVRGRVAYGAGEVRLAKQLMGGATAIAAPLMRSGPQAARARRVYATALTRVGYMKMRHLDLDHGPAQADMRKALAALRAGGPIETDMRTAVVYGDSAAWLQEELGRFTHDYAGADRVGDEALRVARGVLDRRPNHIVAMRVLERVFYNRSVAAEERRQPAAALAASVQSDAVNEAMLRIDPGSQQVIDWKSIHRGNQARALFALGRPDDAARVSDEGLALYARHAPSAYQSGNVTDYAGFRAYIHAQLGETAGWKARLADMRRYAATPVSGGAGGRPEVALYSDATVLRVERVAGDPTATAQAAADLTRRIRAYLDRTGNRSYAGDALVQSLRIEAEIAYAEGDFARAEARSRVALPLAGDASREDGYTQAEVRAEHGLALARLGRVAEARAALATAIAEQRGYIAAGSDDQMLRVELAKSLYAMAWAEPGGAKASLREASTLLDGLPSAMQRYRTVRLWRERVARGTGVGRVERGPTEKSPA